MTLSTLSSREQLVIHEPCRTADNRISTYY